MGVRYPTAFTITRINSIPASGAETLLITTPQLTLPLDGAVVLIFWYMVFAVGTGTTSMTFSLRRGNLLTSPLVSQQQPTVVTASAGFTHAGCYFDNPGAAGGIQYSLTGLGTGTTSSISFLDACMAAFAL